ncbi:MAG: hypothetical protein U0175_08570 [Caldilineaceae bacterium]
MKSNSLLCKSSSIKQGIRRTLGINHAPHLRQCSRFGWRRRIAALLLATVLGLANELPALATSQVDIVGPSGSGSFGSSITVLANGNFVVTDSDYDIPGGATDVGAVYLYNGATHALISTLTGSTSGDHIGGGGVIALSNGNYLIRSPIWDNGSATDAGAVTWGSETIGVSGVVSSNNSLVGSTSGDQVGFYSSYYPYNTGVAILSNGNFVVWSPYWDNGSAIDAGAVTWGSGVAGVSGEVSSSNSLVGSTSGDQLGYYDDGTGVRVLSNGNYLVRSLIWDNGGATNAGAVTWGNGATGVSGEVSSSNSLVGSTTGDVVGHGGVTILSNGNYVVGSPNWDNGSATDAGAVTWGSGAIGVSGVVSSSNSLVGSTSDDNVGIYMFCMTELSNGNYVVSSPDWNQGRGAVTWGNGATGVRGEISSSNSLVGGGSGPVGSCDTGPIVTALSNGNYVVRSLKWYYDLGAVTWGSGTTGVSGEVSILNSLVGSNYGDGVGWGGVTALNNGNYVVSSPSWNNGIGAVTWGNGTTGIIGLVSSNNSLVGRKGNDSGSYVTALNNGNYVVSSPGWNNGSGAVTWGDGATGISGVTSSSNSLVGGGYGYVTALSNGNYVVISIGWNNGGIPDAGAVTWGNGTTGIRGVVSSSNSLVGSTSGDSVGYFGYGVTEVGNGDYVVSSPYWDNGSATDAGAVTWCNGTTGVSGVVSSSNSLVGTTNGDWVGYDGVTILSSGNYVVGTSYWDNGSATDAGAVTWGNGTTGVSGAVSSNNSIVGTTSGDHVGFSFDHHGFHYDSVTVLNNGNYLVSSPDWDNGSALNAGAVTWGNGSTGVSGEVSSSNSLVGSTNYNLVGSNNFGSGVTALGNGNYVVISAGAVTWGDGATGVDGFITSNNSVLGGMNFSYNATYNQLIVGRPAENIVTLFDVSEQPIGNERVYLPVVSR